MNPDSFDLLYKDAEKALLNRHLTEALSCIQGILADTAAAEQHNELGAIRQDYGAICGSVGWPTRTGRKTPLRIH